MSKIGLYKFPSGKYGIRKKGFVRVLDTYLDLLTTDTEVWYYKSNVGFALCNDTKEEATDRLATL